MNYFKEFLKKQCEINKLEARLKDKEKESRKLFICHATSEYIKKESFDGIEFEINIEELKDDHYNLKITAVTIIEIDGKEIRAAVEKYLNIHYLDAYLTDHIIEQLSKSKWYSETENDSDIFKAFQSQVRIEVSK